MKENRLIEKFLITYRKAKTSAIRCNGSHIKGINITGKMNYKYNSKLRVSVNMKRKIQFHEVRGKFQ